MSRPSREPSAPSALLPALLRFVRAEGGDADLLASRFELDGGIEAKDEAPVSARELGAILDAAAGELGDPFLALRLPAGLSFRRYGAAELAARASTTAGSALECLARYAELLFPALLSSFEETAEGARFVQRTPAHPRGVGRAAHEYGLASALFQLRSGTGEGVAATSVWFQHARPSDLAPLARFFGTDELAFGAESSGFTLSRADLDRPMLSGDPRLLATVKDLAESALRDRPGARTVASLVIEKLEVSLADAEVGRVARALAMSARTLQRRLEDEGSSFSTVLDQVRERRARAWLQDPALSSSAVAERLGFADLATFSRAFKRWTGKPPGTWRRS